MHVEQSFPLQFGLLIEPPNPPHPLPYAMHERYWNRHFFGGDVLTLIAAV